MFARHALLIATCCLVLGAGASPARGDDDPPSRAARLAYVQGTASFQPSGVDDWMTVTVNRPLTTGDSIWSDSDGRVELQLDGSTLRLGNNSNLSFLNLGNEVTQIQLSSGVLIVRVRRLDDTETFEVDTPNLAVSILRAGLYKVAVNSSGTATAVKVLAGEAEVTGGGAAYSVHSSENDTFAGTDVLTPTAQAFVPTEDEFDFWSAARDSRHERSTSARYVSTDVVGYSDLDDNGTWQPTPEYGTVWFPRVAAQGWAPYQRGHWDYIAPWGYTWVDDQPWGFAPFHYGRWVSVNGTWGWVPTPPRAEGAVYVRPVYAPALVAWVGVGAGIAWFALGPRDVYVPSYPVSRQYVTNINVSNTTVNTTVVNNYYNTTVINKTVTNVRYVNQNVPGAVVATSSQAFSSAQPVARNQVRVDASAVARAPVQALAPPVVPARQAVLGVGRPAAVKPSAAIQARTVVAKIAPPPAAPKFEQRQSALRENGGNELSAAQVRAIPQPVAAKPVAVKIAPPARPVTVRIPPQAEVPAAPPPRPAAAPPAASGPSGPSARPAPAAPAASAAPITHSAAAPPNPRAVEPRPGVEPTPARPAEKPVHPVDIVVPTPRPPVASPNALARGHQQDAERLQRQQADERLAVQKRQEEDHRRLEQQLADEAKKQQLEKQHAQETELLQQKHAEQQAVLEAKQAEERRKQQHKTAPPVTRPDAPKTP